MHKIYLVGSEKGGVGKTSLSFNMAVLRASAGHPVLLVDTDRQASSSMWATLRAEGEFEPPLVCVQKSGKVGYDLAQLKTNYEVIVDAGGNDSLELRQSIAVADRWIIPVRPSQLDLFSMAKMRQLRTDVEERTGKTPETFIVLNAVSRSTSEARDTRELLTEEFPEMPVFKTEIADRVAMRRAVMAGCGVTELTGKNINGNTNAEILDLYAEIFGEKYHVKK